MPPNMKNFYDPQDIKILIDLKPRETATPPVCSLIINNTELFNGVLASARTFETTIELLDSIDIKISLKDKNYNTAPTTGLCINSLQIDAFNIVPNWTQLAQYSNDKNIIAPTNYLGYNGVWSLSIPEPFYRWQHRITGQGWLLQP